MMASRISCSITFPGMEVRLTGLLFPGSSLLPFLKTGVTLAFLQFSGTSPVLQDLSKMMESGSAMTSASSLSTRGCIPLWVQPHCGSRTLLITPEAQDMVAGYTSQMHDKMNVCTSFVPKCSFQSKKAEKRPLGVKLVISLTHMVSHLDTWEVREYNRHFCTLERSL